MSNVEYLGPREFILNQFVSLSNKPIDQLVVKAILDRDPPVKRNWRLQRHPLGPGEEGIFFDYLQLLEKGDPSFLNVFTFSPFDSIRVAVTIYLMLAGFNQMVVDDMITSNDKSRHPLSEQEITVDIEKVSRDNIGINIKASRFPKIWETVLCFETSWSLEKEFLEKEKYHG